MGRVFTFACFVLDFATYQCLCLEDDLFKDAALPGFRGTGLSNAVNWSSVGVCPGAQAAKAKRAREETPLFVNALTSSAVRATSEALLLRALVDSRDVLMLLNK